MTTETERRSLVLPVERRADEDGVVTVAGYAAVFDQWTDIGGYFLERIAPGAFAGAIEASDVRAYFDHDPGRVLGRKSAGTLRLTEDNEGLAVEIDLPDTTDGRDVRVLVERGDVSGMSIGFRVLRQEWDESGDIPRRTILEVDLREVSIVSEPAYEGTSVALRSLADARRQARAEHNYAGATKRLSERKARMEQRFRGIA